MRCPAPDPEFTKLHTTKCGRQDVPRQAVPVNVSVCPRRKMPDHTHTHTSHSYTCVHTHTHPPIPLYTLTSTHLYILTHTLTCTHSHIPSCPDTHTASHTHTFSHTQHRVPSFFSALPRIFPSSLLRILGSASSNQPPGFLPPPSPLTSESPKLVMRKEEGGFRNGAGGSGPEGGDFRVLFPLSVGLGRLGTGLYLLPPFVWTQDA